MQFHEGSINGVECRNLTKHNDHRGWLTEIFRQDELNGYEPTEYKYPFHKVHIKNRRDFTDGGCSGRITVKSRVIEP